MGTEVKIPKNTTQWDVPKKSLNGHDKHERSISKKAETLPRWPFPIEAFPGTIQTLIQNCQNQLGYESDFMAGAILSALSVAVGRSYSVKLRPGWLEFPLLWICLVGRPGSGKSHPFKTALAPLYREDKRLYKQYQKDLAEYKRYQKLPKTEKATKEEPEAPALRKHLVNDITLEALAKVLTSNERGVGLHADEFAGWLSNFNRYTSGSDTEKWLSLWSGGIVSIDRVTAEPVRLNNPLVSVAGTTQPGVLEGLFRGKVDNGLTDRVLFVWPEQLPAKKWQTEEVDNEIFSAYNRAIEKLLNEQPEKPNELSLSPEANKTFGEFYNDNQNRIESEQDERTQSLLSKLDIIVARISLLLELAKYGCSVSNGTPTSISKESVEGAIKLATYFEQQALKVRKKLFDSTPVEGLDKTKQNFYDALPECFATHKAVEIAKEYNFPERSVKRMLNDKKLFCKIRYGYYERLF